MKPWQKPRPALVERFHEAAAGVEGLEVRKMFGYPAGFVGGNLAVCMFEDTFAVRLAEDDRNQRLDEGWAQFAPMTGRPMREYVELPDALAADPAATRQWIERAAAYVRTLPPKAPKPKREARAAREG